LTDRFDLASLALDIISSQYKKGRACVKTRPRVYLILFHLIIVP
jgi:hypothetical protein